MNRESICHGGHGEFEELEGRGIQRRGFVLVFPELPCPPWLKGFLE